ncbi:MAG: hypothetical protein DUW69_000280 [Verrucomicrobia bacterium]|nr:MAG: hypothetical protein DUW69_000280 [Verrucomicrobiota bacterium]
MNILMKTRLPTLPLFVAASLLAGCAGTPQAPRPTALPTPAPVAAARPAAPKFYIITFDAAGVAHDRTGVVISRDRVLQLMTKGDIDRHTGIRIELPKGLTDHAQSMQAFSRAQQVAKIFDLLSFEAVVVVLAD